MAGRTRSRKELREQVEAAERQEAGTKVADPTAPVKPVRAPRAARPKAPPRPRASRARKPKVPVRLVARWGVFDGSMKRVALFDYNQRTAADQKVVDLLAKKSGVFFLQLVKEPMPEALAEATV